MTAQDLTEWTIVITNLWSTLAVEPTQDNTQNRSLCAVPPTLPPPPLSSSFFYNLEKNALTGMC